MTANLYKYDDYQKITLSTLTQFYVFHRWCRENNQKPSDPKSIDLFFDDKLLQNYIEKLKKDRKQWKDTHKE